MRIERDRKLFVGIRIDNKMREQLANCAARDKQYVDGSNPEYLSQIRTDSAEPPGESYIGKAVDAGAAATSMEDLRRNIMSILNRVAPGRHREDAVKVYALDDGEPPPLPEAPPRDRGGYGYSE